MKKIIVMFVVFSLVMTQFVSFNVLASGNFLTDSPNENLIRELSAIGVIDKSYNGNNTLTRIELAKFLVAISPYDYLSSLETFGNSDFSDVKKDDANYKYINAVYNLKYMNGYPDGSFLPDKEVEYNELIVTAIRLLGYDSQVESNGGYPNGYIQLATTLRLLQNVTVSSKIVTQSTAVKLLYNCLDVKVLNVNYGNKEKYDVGKTLKELIYKRLDLHYTNGIVTANYTSTLDYNTPYIKLDNDEICIDKVKYKVNDKDMQKLLGYNVSFYYVQDYDDLSIEPKIIEMYPNGTKNREYIIPTDDFISAQSGIITYHGNSKSNINEKISYNLNSVMIYNGRAIDFDTNRFNLNRGNIRILSNMGLEQADIVFISDAKSYTVSKISKENDLIYLKFKFSTDLRSIDLSNGNISGKFINLKNQNDDSITISDIKPDDVIVVRQSLSGDIIDIYVVTKKIEGNITEINIDEGDVYVSGVQYKIDKGLRNANVLQSKDMSIGNTGIFYVDNENYIVSFVRDSSISSNDKSIKKYIYPVRVGISDGLSAKVQLKFINPGTIATMEDNTDPNNIVRWMELSNKSIQYSNFAKSIGVSTYGEYGNYNDYSTNLRIKDSNRIIEMMNTCINNNQAIYCTFNQQGDISFVEIPKIYTSYLDRDNKLQSMVYNSSNISFYNNNLGAFKATDKIAGFVIPVTLDVSSIPQKVIFNNSSLSDNDYFIRKKMQNGQANYMTSFDADKDTSVANAFSVFQTNRSDDVNTDFTYSLILVDKVSKILDEHDNAVTKIKGYENNKLSEFYAPEVGSSNITLAEDIMNLQQGDIISINVNGLVKVTQLNIYAMLQNNDTATILKDISDTSYSQTFGKVVGVQRSYLNKANGEYQTRVDISKLNAIEGMPNMEVCIPNKLQPNIYVFNKATKKITLGAIEDIIALTEINGNTTNSSVYAAALNGTLKMFVIIK